MGLLIAFFLLSILASFLCSIWEAVLLSITPSYVNTEVRKKSKLGEKLNEFKEDIDKPLSAILTLNTIAHTVGAIGVGAQAAAIFSGSKGLDIGPLHLSMESIIATLMTLAILVLSEIIPKTIGANQWRSLAPFTVKSLTVLEKVLMPFIWMSKWITKSLKKDKSKSVFSRADFLAMADIGASSGELQENETSIIVNLLGMDKLKVMDVMTPRVVMQIINEKESLQHYYDNHQPLRFSRIPVYEGKVDNISGIVLKNDILKGIIDGNGDKPLESIKRDVKVIRQDKSLRELFSYLTDEKEQITIAVDNYGSVTGLATMEDTIETILGLEIIDETDGVADMQALARKKWEDRAKKIGIIE